jgi:hypothetical protein
MHEQAIKDFTSGGQSDFEQLRGLVRDMLDSSLNDAQRAEELFKRVNSGATTTLVLAAALSVARECPELQRKLKIAELEHDDLEDQLRHAQRCQDSYITETEFEERLEEIEFDRDRLAQENRRLRDLCCRLPELGNPR